MNTLSLTFLKKFLFQLRATLRMVVGRAGFVLLVFTVPVGAQESTVPWECSEYSGEAPAGCMWTLLELQEEKKCQIRKRSGSPTANDSVTISTPCATGIGHSRTRTQIHAQSFSPACLPLSSRISAIWLQFSFWPRQVFGRVVVLWDAPVL